MTILSKAWNNFRAQSDIWFFYGFLITFTLTIRKVLFFYPIAGQFNEWSGIYLYLGDVFLFLALIIWVANILCNNYDKLSIATTKLWLKKAFINLPPHQKNSDINQETYAKKLSFWCGGLPLIFVIWSFASILWSENQNIALFRAIKLLELYLLYVYIIFRVVHPTSILPLPRGESEGGVIKCTFQIIITLGFIQAMIGIWQFIIQHSIGFFWLKESLISSDLPGVAKIVLHGEKFIRSYGLFPHPNILGGFLLVSIILTWAYYKMFHPISLNFVPCGTKLRRGANMEHLKILQGETLLYIALTIQVVALILTFSKSAIIGLVIALGYLWYKFNKNKELEFHPSSNVPRGTYYGTSMKQLALMFGIIFVIAGIWLYLANLNFETFLFKSLDERLSSVNVSHPPAGEAGGTSFWNYLGGFGIGQYVVELVKQTGSQLEAWQYQPVHNVFWLILSELGFVGVFVSVWFLWKLFHLSSILPLSRGGSEEGVIIFKSILLALLFIMFFDHYLWDIQQGEIMLWLVLGIVAGLKVSNLTKE